MPEQKRRMDSVWFYFTGAGSDGGAQSDPDLSIGDYRSSTICTFLASSGTVTNVTIDKASGANGPGSGILEVNGAGTQLRWTPPGGVAGDWVTIGAAETKMLEGGALEFQKFVRVTTSGALTPTDSSAVVLTDVVNDVVGFDNVTVAEQAAGDDEYRCVCLKNESSLGIAALLVYLKTIGTTRAVDATGYAASGAIVLTIKTATLADWPVAGFFENENTGEAMYYAERSDTTITIAATGRDIYSEVGGGSAGSEDDALYSIPGIRIGKEAPSAQPSGNFATPADEDTAPGGVTFEHPISAADADVINIGALNAANIYAIWIHRKVIIGATPLADILNSIAFDYQGT